MTRLGLSQCRCKDRGRPKPIPVEKRRIEMQAQKLQTSRKLSPNRETIRNLAIDALHQVNGGGASGICLPPQYTYPAPGPKPPSVGCTVACIPTSSCSAF